jgi:hypothetical protein
MQDDVIQQIKQFMKSNKFSNYEDLMRYFLRRCQSDLIIEDCEYLEVYPDNPHDFVYCYKYTTPTGKKRIRSKLGCQNCQELKKYQISRQTIEQLQSKVEPLQRELRELPTKIENEKKRRFQKIEEEVGNRKQELENGAITARNNRDKMVSECTVAKEELQKTKKELEGLNNQKQEIEITSEYLNEIFKEYDIANNRPFHERMTDLINKFKSQIMAQKDLTPEQRSAEEEPKQLETAKPKIEIIPTVSQSAIETEETLETVEILCPKKNQKVRLKEECNLQKCKGFLDCKPAVEKYNLLEG